MSVIGLFICIIIGLISWKLWRDFLNPVFILSIEWILMYIIILFSFGYHYTNDFYYIVFSVGFVFFFMGFFVFNNKQIKKNLTFKNKISYSVTFNPYSFSFLLGIQMIVVSIIVYKLHRSLQVYYVNNLWYSIMNASKYGTYESNIIIERLRLFVIIFPIVSFAIYMLNKNLKNKFYFFLNLFISIPVIFTMSRSGMIMIIMTMIFLFLIINNYNNKKIAKWGIVLFFLIIVIFSITSIWKFFNISALENNPIKILQYSFMNYFAPPMVIFVKFLKESNSLLFGKNTFRFFYAILNFLGSDVEVVGVVQEFTKMEINNLNIVSNVYTVLHYYTRDFGLLFAFVIQFILGMIHGFLFHKVRISKKNNIFLIIVFSIMMFPLFMQFFDDNYFSILSTWIQYIFWIWFLTRKKLILKVD